MQGLDQHITGNYGEDQFPSVEPPEFSEEDLAVIRDALQFMRTTLESVSPHAAQESKSINARINKYLESCGW